MITNKQEQGFKVLNSVVTTEFPFIKKIVPQRENVYHWIYSFDVDLHINLLELSKYVGMPFSEKFKDMDIEKLRDVMFDWNKWGLSYVSHFFDDIDDSLGYKFNRKIEEYMFKVYSQLPKEFTINCHENHPKKDEVMDLLKHTFEEPKKVGIGNVIFYVD
jgi:hypothetical protein